MSDNENWLYEDNDHEETLEMIEDIMARDNLSDWNKKFIDSIHEQFTEKRWISEKQYSILRRIHNGRY